MRDSTRCRSSIPVLAFFPTRYVLAFAGSREAGFLEEGGTMTRPSHDHAATAMLFLVALLAFTLLGMAAGPPAPNAGSWVKVGTGDCSGLDVDSSEGSIPDVAKGRARYTAVCWDGKQYNNRFNPGRAFCTYKDVDYGSCRGGANIGVMYRWRDAKEWEDLLPDFFRSTPRASTNTIRARGVVIEPRGEVEIWHAAFDRWVGPIRADSQIYEGDRVRTAGGASCRVVFTSREGLQDTVSVGSDTLVEIPRSPRPELSIAAELLIGLIQIKSRLTRERLAVDEDDDPFVVRTPTFCTGTRGTEFVLSAAADGSGSISLAEGEVQVFAIPTGQITKLRSGQQADFAQDGTARVFRLDPAAYQRLLNQNRIVTPAALTVLTTHDLPELKATVVALRVYEGPNALLPPEGRNFQTRFAQAQVRRLWWQLDLTFPSPGPELRFDLKGILYKADGTVFAEMPIEGRVEAGWTNSQHTSGWGWDRPGQWPPGSYRLEVVVNARKVGETSFTIDPTR